MLLVQIFKDSLFVSWRKIVGINSVVFKSVSDLIEARCVQVENDRKDVGEVLRESVRMEAISCSRYRGARRMASRKRD